MTTRMLRTRFDAARNAAGIDKKLFQFRDLRANAATEMDDAGGIRQTQALLGHTTEGMTANDSGTRSASWCLSFGELQNTPQNCGTVTEMEQAKKKP